MVINLRLSVSCVALEVIRKDVVVRLANLLIKRGDKVNDKPTWERPPVLDWWIQDGS